LVLIILAAIAGAFAVGLLVANLPRRPGKASIRNNLAMAPLMLGFGQFFDPPVRHIAEAQESQAEDEDAAGDPPPEE